jgi:2-hydroxy-4-carboxymuconate semialdehyde hemiacetal dehydrogenase
MNVGILGYGAIAAEHARALTRAGCALSAVAGPDGASAAAFAREHAVARVAGSVEALVAADDVEAVVIASPNALHPEQALLCLEHGKHVLCEVPFACTLAAAERVAAAAAAAAGVQMLVCQTQRFLEPLAWLRHEPAARRIHHIAVRLVVDRTTNVGITGRRRSWTDDLVWHHGSHAVDTVLWLLDEPIADVVALAAGESADGTPLDAGIVLRARSGALATIALSYTAKRASTDFMVNCDGVTYRYERGVLSSSDGLDRTYDEAELFAEAVHSQDAAFADAVATGRPAAPGPADLLAAYEVLQRISDQAGAATP